MPPAVPQILSFHGAGPNPGVDVSGGNVRHRRDDLDTPDQVNPIPIPAAGVNYGWPKHWRCSFSTTPSSTIRNLVWYAAERPASNSDPALEWSGMTLWAGINASYAQGNTNDSTALRAGLVAADTLTANTPLVVNSGTVLSNPATGVGTQPYVVTQVSVSAATLPGEKAQWVTSYKFEEI